MCFQKRKKTPADNTIMKKVFSQFFILGILAFTACKVGFLLDFTRKHTFLVIEYGCLFSCINVLLILYMNIGWKANII